jgi:hypothetical protein
MEPLLFIEGLTGERTTEYNDKGQCYRLSYYENGHLIWSKHVPRKHAFYDGKQYLRADLPISEHYYKPMMVDGIVRSVPHGKWIDRVDPYSRIETTYFEGLSTKEEVFSDDVLLNISIDDFLIQHGDSI